MLCTKVQDGFFCELKKFQAVIEGLPVAVKLPKKQKWATSTEQISFLSEVQTLKYTWKETSINFFHRKIVHPNVVLFLGCCTQPGNVLIVLERMVCDLDAVLHKPDKVPKAFRKRFFKTDLTRGLTLPIKLKMAHDTVTIKCFNLYFSL